MPNPASLRKVIRCLGSLVIACKPKWSGSVSERHFSVSPRQISEESRREAEVQTEGKKEAVCPFCRGHSVCPAPFFLFSQSLLPPALPPSQFLLFNCVPYPITLFKCYLFALTFSAAPPPSLSLFVALDFPPLYCLKSLLFFSTLTFI